MMRPLWLLLLIWAWPLPASTDSVRQLANTFRTASDPARRIEAARKLAALGSKARGIVPILAEGLDDARPAVSAAAAFALGRIADLSALKPLIQLLDSTRQGYDRAREQAALALGRIGDKQAAPALLRSLLRQPPILNAVDAIARVQGRDAVRSIINLLKKTTNQSLQLRCMTVLGRLGQSSAIPHLDELLKQQKPTLVLGAIEAISQIGGRAGLRPLLRFLRRDGQQPSITIAALQVVSRYAHEDATATITRLADHPVPQIREVVCIALGRIGDPRSQQTLSRLVTDSSWSVRAGAAHALGSLGKPRLLSPLAKALRDSNRYVRVDAARALGRCGLPQAAPHLADRLGREPDPTVRRALVRGLEQLGRPEAVPAILPMLTDPQPDVRAAAAHALGGLDATQSLLHLYRALEDTAPGVRYAAAHSLARLGPTIGLALAERRLERERDPAICLWLEALLLRSQRDARDGKTLISALNQAGPLRLVATQALAVAGHQPALTPILRLLSGATPEEQTVYISALGQLGGSKAVTPLRLMLEQNQARTGFLKKLSLIKALGRLAHAEATSALTRILNQEPQSWPLDGWQAVQLRLAALWSLSRINSKGAVDGLLSAWNDTNPQVRRRAASLLVTLGVRIRQQLETRLKQARGGKKLWLASVLARLR